MDGGGVTCKGGGEGSSTGGETLGRSVDFRVTLDVSEASERNGRSVDACD